MKDENDKWECFLCCKEDDFDILPYAYLGNYHPLCKRCADDVLYDENHLQHQRLTYHKDVGDFIPKENSNWKRIYARKKRQHQLDEAKVLAALGVDNSWITVVKRNSSSGNAKMQTELQ